MCYGRNRLILNVLAIRGVSPSHQNRYHEIHGALYPERDYLGAYVSQVASHAVEFHECSGGGRRRDEIMEYLPMPWHQFQRVGDA